MLYLDQRVTKGATVEEVAGRMVEGDTLSYNVVHKLGRSAMYDLQVALGRRDYALVTTDPDILSAKNKDDS